ncbi:hypothetical protein E4U54_003657 [Claviceps lovelessii]|nr:hypothetical protein E4U54_003657 [Claviceps lovelessii]
MVDSGKLSHVHVHAHVHAHVGGFFDNPSPRVLNPFISPPASSQIIMPNPSAAAAITSAAPVASQSRTHVTLPTRAAQGPMDSSRPSKWLSLYGTRPRPPPRRCWGG